MFSKWFVRNGDGSTSIAISNKPLQIALTSKTNIIFENGYMEKRRTLSSYISYSNC